MKDLMIGIYSNNSNITEDVIRMSSIPQQQIKILNDNTNLETIDIYMHIVDDKQLDFEMIMDIERILTLYKNSNKDLVFVLPQHLKTNLDMDDLDINDLISENLKIRTSLYSHLEQIHLPNCFVVNEKKYAGEILSAVYRTHLINQMIGIKKISSIIKEGQCRKEL